MSDDFEALLSRLRGKSVAIVGNAASILQKNDGALIDAHDIVIRMNRGAPVLESAQGKKFDVWCYSTGRWVKSELPEYPRVPAIWMSPKLREEQDPSFPCAFYPMELWQEIFDLLRARPSVGAMTCHMLAGLDLKMATCFGFDFKVSGTFYELIMHVGPHDFTAESDYIRGLCQSEKWAFVSCAQ